ncbi:MarR family winged helix-turn-helix transcriptional regulator [Noviherbaspirillum saxi]|nr:MarR family transcriptional regulator [Noviherbaspirillum saxi]
MTQKKATASTRPRKVVSAKKLEETDELSTIRQPVVAESNGKFQLRPSTSKLELLDEGGNTDHRFRQFLYDFSVLATQLETARAYLAAHVGVTSPQYNILMIIARNQGEEGVSVSDVARYLHVTGAFITAEVRKLENIGLVEKRPNPNDARSTLLRLSPEGETRIRDVEPERLFVNDNLFQNLSGKDFQHLSATLSSLLDDFANTNQMLQMRQERNKRAQASRNRKVG